MATDKIKKSRANTSWIHHILRYLMPSLYLMSNLSSCNVPLRSFSQRAATLATHHHSLSAHQLSAGPRSRPLPFVSSELASLDRRVVATQLGLPSKNCALARCTHRRATTGNLQMHAKLRVKPFKFSPVENFQQLSTT